MTIYTTNVRSSYLEGLAFHIKPKTHEYLFLGKSYDGFAHKKSVNDVHIHDVVYLNMEERLEWNHMTEIVL